MRAFRMFILGSMVGLVACSDGNAPDCTPPDGCVASSAASGRCECLEWKVIADDVVPLKFLVIGLIGSPPGDRSVVTYGNFSSSGSPWPAASSQFGTRVRAVLNGEDGKQIVATVQVPTGNQAGWALSALGSRTLAVAMPGGMGVGLPNILDLQPVGDHRIAVWVNPALRILRDAGGRARGVWAWTGTCGIFPSCEGPTVLLLERAFFDGSVPPPDFLQTFIGSLTPPERAAILAYDRVAATPPPTEAALDADRRFLRLGAVQVDSAGSTGPDTAWRPCVGIASEDDFPVFARTEFQISTSESVAVEQSWLTASIGCTWQRPGFTVGTNTPGCQASAVAYVDRMFGTLAFLPGAAADACTRL